MGLRVSGTRVGPPHHFFRPPSSVVLTSGTVPEQICGVRDGIEAVRHLDGIEKGAAEEDGGGQGEGQEGAELVGGREEDAQEEQTDQGARGDACPGKGG